MKISNASKKGLAAALSAAMVVAFAPAAAFGQVVPGDQVTVKFDTKDLTVKSMNAEFDANGYAAGVNADNVLTLPEAALSGHAYQFDANTDVAGWYFDANDNGKYDDKDITLTGGVLDFTKNSNLVNAGNTITLKPFKQVAAGVKVADVTKFKQEYKAGSTFTVSLSNDETKAADNLRLSISKDGTEVAYALTSLKAATAAAAPGGKVTAATDDVVFNVIAKDATAKKANEIKASDLGKGKYTVTVSKADSLKAVATSEFEVVSVKATGLFKSTLAGTAKDQIDQDILMVAGQSVESQLIEAAKEIDVLAAKANADSSATIDAVAYKVGDKKAVEYKSSTWAKATGLDESVKVAADTVLTPVYGDVATAGELTINDVFTELTAGVDSPKSGAEYDFELTGPATATVDKVASSKAGSVKLYTFDSNGAKAGKYTVTITQVENRGTNLEKKTVVGSSSLTLTQLTYDAGEGKLAAGTKATAIVKAGTKFADAGLLASSAVEPKAGFRFVGWSLDGATVVAAKDKVGEDAATLKAVYAASTAAEPTFSYENGKLTLVNNAGAGYDVYYDSTASGSGTTADPYVLKSSKVKYSAPITVDVDKVDTIYVQTVKKNTTSGLGDSAVVKVTNYAKSATAVEGWVKLAIANTTGANTLAAPQYYSKVLPTLAADAKAAVKALNYGTDKDWAKAELEQKQAALKAIADYETAQIDAYVAGVTAADGSMKKVPSSVAEKQKAEIAQVLTDFEYNNDDKDATKAKGTYTAPTTAENYVKAIAKASKSVIDASVTYKAEDVKAAAVVNDAIAKIPAEITAKNAKEAKAAAEAALKAYAELSATQKDLVKSADYDKAVQTITAADAAVKDADKAAVAKVKGKTVKAKAKKATKSSLKVVKSESGAKSTFKKTSGNSKVKVYKSGKIVVKKGLKAGKKYTVKVKATVGTQTKTVKVTVKVAK